MLIETFIKIETSSLRFSCQWRLEKTYFSITWKNKKVNIDLLQIACFFYSILMKYDSSLTEPNHFIRSYKLWGQWFFVTRNNTELFCSCSTISANIKSKSNCYYSVIGSLGIAVYRILLIKYDILERYKIGKRKLMFIILMCEFVLMVVIIGTRSIYNPFWNPLRPTCMYQTTKSIIQILDDYQISLGYPSLLRQFV